ncbi:GntR family transcriptional regulator [Cellulomonas xylanilytica]|uniref:GntR family transcriptional regulator n=1 Tax=Cellulomonas xylanilytica TaxID=233583 RepID=A0A510V6W3_9CELL|nr:GntR family transcriptional regulator [Cellulomonas xylanilytica]
MGDALVTIEGGQPAHVALERSLRAAVREGRLRPGDPLPPSRALARDLGVSRWVVTQAYGALVAEGALDARTGAGTRVAATSWPTLTAPREPDHPAQPRPRFDLGPGVPDLRHLPRTAWVGAVRTAVSSASPGDLVTPDPRGVPALRHALADRLAVTRAVLVDADAVVVTHGAADGMTRLARSLHAAGHDHVLVEDPSWPRLRDVAAAAGLQPVPVPVDADGVDVGALVAAADRTGARAALVTPSHQFPVGAALAPARREALVRWARSVDGVVVEDDYDAEFRYDRRPVAALRALAPDRVALLGSLSKTLAPGFGVGWLVPPDDVPAARAGLDVHAGAPPSLHQLACAALLSGGAYDRHLRSARTRYRRRRAALLVALERHLPGLPVTGLAAGLHVVLALPPGVDEHRVARLAARRDVRVVPASRYRIGAATAASALVVGYGNLVDARLDEAVARLAGAVTEAA